MDAQDYLNSISPQLPTPEVSEALGPGKKRKLLIIIAMIVSIVLIIVFMVFVLIAKNNSSQGTEESLDGGLTLFCKKSLNDFSTSDYSIIPEYGRSDYYMLFTRDGLKSVLTGVELNFSDSNSAETMKESESAKVADTTSNLNQNQYPSGSVFLQDGNILSVVIEIDLESQGNKYIGPYAPSELDLSIGGGKDNLRRIFESDGYSCSGLKLYSEQD